MTKQIFSPTSVFCVVVIVAAILAFVWNQKSEQYTESFDDIDSTKFTNRKSLESKLKDIDTMAKAMLECRDNFPGMSMAIVQDSKVIATKGYGYTDMNRQIKVDENTVFGMGSLSKAFTATLALKVLKQRGLSHKTRVADILGPEFRLKNHNLTHLVTVGDLLSHRLGVAMYNFLRYQTKFSRQQLVGYFRHFKSVAPFRGSYVYSNLAYGLVAHITEVLANRPFEDLLEDEIFRVTGMNNTFLRSRDHKVHSLALPHVTFLNETFPLCGKLFRHLGRLGASGSVMTTAVDAAKWLYVNLNNGRSPDGTSAIPASVIEDAHKPKAYLPIEKYWFLLQPTIPVSYIFDRYASGWKNGFYRGHTLVTHTGTTLGYSAMITMIPALGLGIYTSFNNFDRLYYARISLHTYIIDVLLGEQPWHNQSTLCSFPEPWSRVKPKEDKNIVNIYKARRELIEYVGTYESVAFGSMYVSINETYLQIDYGMLKMHLYPNHALDFFQFKGIDSMRFIVGEYLEFKYNCTKSAIVSLIIGIEKKDPPVFRKVFLN